MPEHKQGLKITEFRSWQFTLLIMQFPEYLIIHVGDVPIVQKVTVNLAGSI